MSKRRATFGILLIVMLSVPAPVLAGQALLAIETRVNKVLEVLGDPALKGESYKGTKEKKVRLIVDEIFDYAELSKRALSFHWESFTPEQQKEFTHLFGRLLGGAYMDRILAYTNEKVAFGKEIRLSENRTEVESEIVTPTKSIPIHYRMIHQKGQWKVYDVVIEGVSLVQNYRSQFRGILAKETPEGLLKTLRARTA
ncbi:MAG: ABC transporter substrate-binding protein [Syntrophaceae bacterium]|nr:ABC transporter substrate-binding protein [Syntrophaceae bacterium]